MESKWSTGLFDCFRGCLSDGITCLGCWCPCVLYGRNAESTTGEDGTSACCDFALVKFFSTILLCGAGSLCVMPAFTMEQRKALRKAYHIEEEGCCGNSYCVQCFCLRCSLCQEARELKRRGHTPENPLAKHLPLTAQKKERVTVTRAPSQVEAEAPVPAPAPAPAEFQSIGLPSDQAYQDADEAAAVSSFLLRMLTARSQIGNSGRADVSFGFLSP
jgi:Cys-rich protein (TIGR01571 family)